MYQPAPKEPTKELKRINLSGPKIPLSQVAQAELAKMWAILGQRS